MDIPCSDYQICQPTFITLFPLTLHSHGYAVVYNQPQPYLFAASSATYDSQNLSMSKRSTYFFVCLGILANRR